LKRYLASMTRDPSRADDLLQETFLQMHRARATHIPGEAVRPWVFAIAKRVFLMYRRSTSRRQRYEQMSAAAVASVATAVPADTLVQSRQQLESALRQTPSEARRAFMLHHLFGFSFKEIGAKLRVSSGAAKIRSSRAAHIMRAWLRENNDE
jgi:RNA polymerase sigma-70 factor, ECF subfamily